MHGGKVSRFGLALAGAMLVVVFGLTLTPAPGTPTSTNFWTFAGGEFGAVDVVANVALFVPLGFALSLVARRRWPAVALCVATTVVVELLQVHVVVGRDASFSDLVANSVGGWIGVEIAANRRRLFHPQPSTAVRLSLVWCALFTAVGAATSWALRPAFVPRSLWVQWLPPRPNYEPFTGELVAFDLEGIELPSGFPSPSLGIDEKLMRDRWRATATVERDGIEARRSVIVRISEEYTQPVALEQRGWDLTCLQRTRSAELRFRSPRVALPNALLLSSGSNPDTTFLSCERRDGAIVASVDARSQAREEVLRLSPSLGWALLYPFDIALHAGTRWMSALWLFALAVPFGYWGAAASATGSLGSMSRRALVAWIAIALGLALVVAPVIADVAAAAWWEWGAALGGIATGAVVARLIWRLAAQPAGDGRVARSYSPVVQE
jgi:hypothetical protein